jgi:hypothetical protein
VLINKRLIIARRATKQSKGESLWTELEKAISIFSLCH